MARPKRTDEEKIEDAFCDLTIERQAAMLETLHKLHRWTERIRAQQPQAEDAQQ